MYELLKARVGKALVFNTLSARGMRRSYQMIHRSEEHFKKMEAMYAAAFAEGNADGVHEDLIKELADFVKVDASTLDMEERSVVISFRILMKYMKEVVSLEVLEKATINWIDSGAIPFENERQKDQLIKDMRVIVKVFSDDAELVHDVLLQLARLSRDQLAASEGKLDKERLRDIVGALFTIAGEARSRFKTMFLRTKIRRIQRNEKQVETVMSKLRAVFGDGKKTHTPLGVKEVAGEIHELAELVRREGNALSTYLEESRFILIFAVHHFFVMTANLNLIRHHKEQLANSNYFKDKLKAVEDQLDASVMKIAETTQKVMRESYQEYHTLDNITGESSKTARLLNQIHHELR